MAAFAELGSDKGKGVALDLENATATPPTPPRRRARSATFVGDNPIDIPLNPADFQLVALREKILKLQEAESKNAPINRPRPRSVSFVAENPLDAPFNPNDLQLAAYREQLKREKDREGLVEQFSSRATNNNSTLRIIAEKGSVEGVTFYRRTSNEVTDVLSGIDWDKSIQQTHEWFVKDKKKGHKRDNRPKTPVPADTKMNNYQNYIDPAGSASGAGPRQAPPSPSQNVAHSNGMNGGMGMGGMVGFPTPAGHQSDLNYIMSMVEDLSAQLRHNQQVTANIVEKVGKVREKAATMNLTNDELVAVVASELNTESKNLDKEVSELRKRLEKAEHDKAENWKLACHGANILADITEKMHKFREDTDRDILTWHKNYRNQLATERSENLELRNQINDMKAAAGRANEHLRQMRRWLDDHDELHELRVQAHQYRLERRFWKRMALPLIPDDDSEWSDDDDLIDPEIKKLEAALAAEKLRKDKEDPEGGEGTSA